MDFQSIFRSAPGLYLVLSPELSIIDASQEYARATLTLRKEIKGCSLFDVFPDNPNEPDSDGVLKLRTSLTRVLREGLPDRMPMQRYDVRDYVSGNGEWVEKYWATINRPIFDRGSTKITYLLHQVEDVTEVVFMSQWVKEEAVIAEEQRTTLKQMRIDLRRRRRALRTAMKRLSSLLRLGCSGQEILSQLRSEFHLPPTPRYLSAGDRAPRTGIYSVFHQHLCTLAPSSVFVTVGQSLLRCFHCGDAVLYRLDSPL